MGLKIVFVPLHHLLTCFLAASCRIPVEEEDVDADALVADEVVAAVVVAAGLVTDELVAAGLVTDELVTAGLDVIALEVAPKVLLETLDDADGVLPTLAAEDRICRPDEDVLSDTGVLVAGIALLVGFHRHAFAVLFVLTVVIMFLALHAENVEKQEVLQPRLMDEGWMPLVTTTFEHMTLQALAVWSSVHEDTFEDEEDPENEEDPEDDCDDDCNEDCDDNEEAECENDGNDNGLDVVVDLPDLDDWLSSFFDFSSKVFSNSFTLSSSFSTSSR
ncbi:hypothetical protein ACLMJK_000008 [Lecanora helva]